MSVTVKFFARLREQYQLDELQIEAANGMTAMQVWQQATGEQRLPEHTLVAINQQYAAVDSAVKDSDEVAFFPPVTGG